MSKCGICGEPSEDDLFSYVTGEAVCSLCKVQFIGGLPTTPERIKQMREALGLVDGKYLKQDRAETARKILGRR